jgi:hypothetical protein
MTIVFSFFFSENAVVIENDAMFYLYVANLKAFSFGL